MTTPTRDGDLHAVVCAGRWYVVGNAVRIPVEDCHAALILIADMNAARGETAVSGVTA